MQKLLEEDNLKNIIIQSIQWLHDNNRAHTLGLVVMPNHIHLLWSSGINYTMAKAENDLLSFTGHAFKKYLTKENPSVLNNYLSTQTDRSYHFWERRERTIEIMSRNFA